MKARTNLSEKEKIEIIHCIKSGIRNSRVIGKLINKPKSTVFSFISSYEKNGTIFPKRGRPTKTDHEQRRHLIEELEKNPFLPLRDQESNSPIGKETIRKIRIQEKFDYFKMTPICQLSKIHIQERLRYFNEVTSGPIKFMVFTDESTVQEDLSRKGIWRRRGHYPRCHFTQKKHTLCMRFGGDWPIWISNKPSQMSNIGNRRKLL